MTSRTTVDPDAIKEEVRTRYGKVATGALANCCAPAAPQEGTIPWPAAPASCCGPADTGYAGQLYSQSELAGLPDSATQVSLGCGNPTAIAALQPGQVVLDLGSGGGIDCFLAARQVGPTGRVIGLDMTPEMIELARRNQAALGAVVANVTFEQGEMEAMPLPDASVDVIISNCVINLSPDKEAVFAEAHRVLKPGGYLAVSDIVLRRPLPATLAGNLAAWTGCVAGALDVHSYADKLRRAGFGQVEFVGLTPTDFGASEGIQGEAAQVAAALAPGGLKSWIASAQIVAHKG